MKKLFGKNTENRRVEEERWVNLYFWRKIFPLLVISEMRINLCNTCSFILHSQEERVRYIFDIYRTEKAHSSFIGKKFTVGKHHVVVEVGVMLFQR